MIHQDENSSPAGRPRRLNRQLPKRYRDTVPEPLPLLPPFSAPTAHPSIISSPSPPASNPQVESSDSTLSDSLEPFRTPKNIFGLLRQYCSDKLPTHDPEEYVVFQDLTDNSLPTNEPSLRSQTSRSFSDNRAEDSGKGSFGPYPNRNSFLLGDWYWNHGIQKSRQNFNLLLNIVGDQEFRPEDVRHTNWRKIDAQLAKNDFDEQGSVDDGLEPEWLDEDAGWKRTSISILVPFHSRTKRPGPKSYIVGDLYHRSLVSIIREKLANSQEVRKFHYEPFELLWNPTVKSSDIRVHGELYTSPAFLEAHRDLQDSPGEPGCSLPRFVVAMMFWSDATRLTSFGNAKLWPSYLFFGNESKYRRCKPSCHLCNHVAYFQTVSYWLFWLQLQYIHVSYSFQTHLKTLQLKIWEALGPVKPL